MNAAPPTMVRNPVTLTITPTTSTACVVINPTTSSTIPINTAAAAATVRRSQTRSMVCLAAKLGVIVVEGTLDLVEPALFVLGEWHGSFSRPEPYWTVPCYVGRSGQAVGSTKSTTGKGISGERVTPNRHSLYGLAGSGRVDRMR